MSDNSSILAPLLQMLDEIKPLSKPLRSALVKSFQQQKVTKGTILLQEENICKDVWFLADGLLRSYHNIGEKEITSRIMFTGHIVISPGSFFTQTPAIESIEALADSTVCTLSFAALQKLYAAYPEFNYHTRIVTEQYFYKQEQRLYMLRQHDALSKYKYFLSNYANYLQHIPQAYIASFLGISRETLSRMRNKIRK